MAFYEDSQTNEPKLEYLTKADSERVLASVRDGNFRNPEALLGTQP